MKYWTFTLWLVALAAGSAAAERQSETLSPEHRRWLEEEVPYIILDREKEIFLSLETLEERERFIEAFWRRRDPDPATPENEFKDEHYERLEYANRVFGRYVPEPGWRTDRGEYYISLGKPLQITRFDGYHNLAASELWFYGGGTEKGLPPYFYLLFFQRHDVGDYQLYSPSVHGPTTLIRGESGLADSREKALAELLDISYELAHASLSYDTSEPPDFVTGRAALGTEILLGRIEESPKRTVRTDYIDAWLRYGNKVSADYSFNYIPSRGLFAVLNSPGGAAFLHYSIELDPENFTLAADEERTRYYTTLDVSLEVRDRDANLVLANDKEVYVELSPSRFQEQGGLPFAYQDDFPLVPGDYQVTSILRNRLRTQYTVAEAAISVAPISPEEPGLSDIVLGYRTELTDDDVEEGEIRTFQIGRHRIHPAAEGTFTLGETVHVLAQVVGASAGHSLRLSLVGEEGVLQERTLPAGDLPGGLVTESFELVNMVGGRYLIRGELVEPEGKTVAERQALVQVSPRTSIDRPWVHRRSFNTEVPGLVALTRGEQFLAMRRHEEARRELETAVAAANPDLPQAIWRLAGLYIGWRKPDRALELLLPLAELHPNQYEVAAGLGFAYYLKGDVANAAGYLERAMTIRPAGVSLLNALGDCHLRLGNRERARELFERSLELDPEQEGIKKQLASLSSSP